MCMYRYLILYQPAFFLSSCSALPADGVILRPHPKGDQQARGTGGGVASAVVGGASIHDESFEDDFSDMEGSVIDGNAGNCDSRNEIWSLHMYNVYNV